MQGPVLQPFVYDEAHPYAAGQHRGVDLGADAAGETVVAPATGTVSFAGTVPTNGKSVTIETADGYSVTLTHLGSIAVAKGTTVAEQDAVGTVGPSGTPEVDQPYVHLGIRLTADPNGYVDPLSLLPPAAAGGGSTAPQTTPSVTTPAAPATKPVSVVPSSASAPTRRGSTARSSRSHARAHEQARSHELRSEARATISRNRPAVRAGEGADLHAQQDHTSERTNASPRPVVEPVAPEPDRLGAGDEIRTREPAAAVAPLRRRTPPTMLVPALCNVVPALFALAAALAAARTRRRRAAEDPRSSALVVHLPEPAVPQRRFSRAA